MGARSVALRIAARDAWAHKVRSALVILLVGLPVLVVTIGLVIGRTSDVSAVEGLDRTIGNAEALVEPRTEGPLYQGPDLFWDGAISRASAEGGVPTRSAAPTVEDLRTVLGSDVRSVSVRTGSATLRVDGAVVRPEVSEFALADELTSPFTELIGGRLPTGTDEVLATQSFLDEADLEVGDRVEFAGKGYGQPRVVGVATHADGSYPRVIGEVGSVLPQGHETNWLLDSRPVTWDDVKQLNELGFAVYSRSVTLDPPSADELYPEFYEMDFGSSYDGAAVVIALIVTMVVLEVALLAGPALAVTARQQSRTLALVAAAGGTPKQARGVVIAQGLVLGVGSALVSAALGVLLSIPGVRIAAHFNENQQFGPFDVPWLWIAGVVMVGVVAVFLAAVMPAYLTARQDPVRALAGRRADGRPGRASPLVGLVLVGAGVTGTVLGAQRDYDAEVAISFSAIIVVLGVLLLVPMVLGVLSRLVADLPLPVRFAARDAARHRGRTVPAVAAVMATVAGVVAVGIAVVSQGARDEASYTPSLVMGQSAITSWTDSVDGEEVAPTGKVMAEYARIVADLGHEAQQVKGLASSYGEEWHVSWELLDLGGEPDDGDLSSLSETLGGEYVVVSDSSWIVTDGDETSERIDRALGAGKVVHLVSQESPRKAGEEHFLVQTRSEWEVIGDTSVDGGSTELLRAPVEVEQVAVGDHSNARVLVPPALVEARQLPVETRALLFDRVLDSGARKQIGAALTDVDVVHQPSVYAETGYSGGDLNWALLILAGGGAVLMLAGTLTATFLALSDARPDLATLGAIGAAPRARRSIGGAYALVVSLTGAALGVLVGLVPGLTVAYVTTGPGWYQGYESGPFLEVPWGLVATVVVGLPLLCAGVVWLSARSRLPMVARID